MRACSAVLALVVGLTGVAPAASPDVSIEPSVAGLFVGEEKIVEGTVTSAQRDGNVVHLRVGTAPQDLTVSLVIGMLSNFPNEPERYYVGKTVRVSGTIQSFRGMPEITLHDPVNIQIVGISSAAAAPPATEPAAPAVSKARPIAQETPITSEQRLDALSERLRQLEQRVEQLERSGARGVH